MLLRTIEVRQRRGRDTPRSTVFTPKGTRCPQRSTSWRSAWRSWDKPLGPMAPSRGWFSDSRNPAKPSSHVSDWGRRNVVDRFAAPFAVCVLLLAPAVGEAASPAPARRDTLKRVEGIPISHVEIVCHNIFDPVPSGKLSVLYQLANRLHVRTRTRTVRTQLLFEAGDPWSTAEVLETERNLRALDFLAVDPIDVTQTNDSAFVRVEAWDSWSTNPQFSIQSADGKRVRLARVHRAELSRARQVVLDRVAPDDRGNTRSLSFDDPSLFGTRARLHYYAGDASPGARDEFGVGVPFYAPDHAARVRRIVGPGDVARPPVPEWQGGRDHRPGASSRARRTGVSAAATMAGSSGGHSTSAITNGGLDRPRSSRIESAERVQGGEENLRLRRFRARGANLAPEFHRARQRQPHGADRGLRRRHLLHRARGIRADEDWQHRRRGIGAAPGRRRTSRPDTGSAG